MTTTALIRTMKRFVPATLKRSANDVLLARIFRRAVKEVSDLPLGERPSRQLLSDLMVGWGNQGFAAQLDYLEEVSNQAVKTRGPILECGSGLTTILLGLLAGRRGVETWSLEHFPAWRKRVHGALQRFQIPNVQVCLSPLQSFDGFDWYSARLAEMPKEFRLVICDGPPGDTKGGRYGLLPVLGERLPKDSMILLDDAHRSGEAEVLQRWMSEASFRNLSSAGSPFAAIVRE